MIWNKSPVSKPVLLSSANWIVSYPLMHGSFSITQLRTQQQARAMHPGDNHPLSNVGVVSHWNRLPVVGAPSLKMFKARQGGWNEMISKVPPNSNLSYDHEAVVPVFTSACLNLLFLVPFQPEKLWEAAAASHWAELVLQGTVLRSKAVFNESSWHHPMHWCLQLTGRQWDCCIMATLTNHCW